jgi:hypothetical protein
MPAIVFLFFFVQCRHRITDPYSDVPVDSTYAKDPPIATHVNISLLPEATESGNLLFEATMPKGKVKRDVLALYVTDSSKIVLHDDGKNGDKVAGDGIFSTVLLVDQDSLGIYLRARITEGRRLLDSKQPLFQFAGRMMFPANREELESVFSQDNIKANPADLLKRGVSLLPIRFFPLLTPVSTSFKQNALLVTDPSVINDNARTFNPCTNTGTPGGAWTFGKLMKEMANTPLTGVTPENFALNWLKSWTVPQTANGDVIAARGQISSILSTWQALSGGPLHLLDINKAPFKLLAIVNRFDLHTGGGAYGGGNAGEGRFVFCATDGNCQPLGPPNFLVIFEYGVNKSGCFAIHNYAQQWADLQSLTLGSAAYNSALQAITDQFTLAGTNPGKPNQSSLDQLRTNELALGLSAGLLWELREFHIDANSHQLFNVTVKREPRIPYNSQAGSAGAPIAAQVAALGDFVNSNAATIIADNMDLPDTLSVSGVPTPFQAGRALTPNPTSFHWDAVVAAGPGHINNDTARMHISLNTCSGCHGGETDNGNFTNVDFVGGGIHLSPFLTGLVQPGSTPVFTSLPFLVADRANRPSAATPINWPFNDVERRGRILLDFIGTPCPTIRLPPPLRSALPFIIPFELASRLTFRPLTMTD